MIHTFLLFNALIILILLYAYMYPRRLEDDPSPTEDKCLRLEEYRTLNAEIERRERSMIMMGSIFLPTSFLLMGYAATTGDLHSKIILVYASVTLYSIWLFAVQLTSWWLNEFIYARIHGLEKQIGMEIHDYVAKRTACSFRIHFRRNHWAYFLVFLFISAIIVVRVSGL